MDPKLKEYLRALLAAVIALLLISFVSCGFFITVYEFLPRVWTALLGR
jgi:Flp pilus assembly pilin Flp